MITFKVLERRDPREDNTPISYGCCGESTVAEESAAVAVKEEGG